MKRKLLFAFMSVALMFSFVFVLVSCGEVEKNDNPDTSETKDVYYTVTFKDYDGTVLQTSSVKEGEMPSYNKSNPTREKDNEYLYTFSGWSPSISKVSEDTTYVAEYDKLPYVTVIFKDYDETVLQTSYVEKGGIPTYNGVTPTREKDNEYLYTFSGWSPSISKVSEDTTYVAEYDKLPYVTVIFKDYDETVLQTSYVEKGGIPTYNGVTPTRESDENYSYTFNGWSPSISNVSEDTTYVVEYDKYSLSKIIIDNQASSVEISGVTSGNKYEEGSKITLTATTNSSMYIYWKVNGVIKQCGKYYSFIVPEEDVTITIVATTSSYLRDDNKIYFGKYPQTKVEDNTLISSLNDLAGEKPTSANMHNWTSYKYYISGSVEDYMFYQDIDYDKDGTYDYRGVYFTSYRPYYYSSSSSNTYQDDNGYDTNTIYWFSYDLIEWDILNESDGKVLIIANLILDSQEYYPSDSSSSFTYNGGTRYANNYELSAIREFLNDNFYNTAFNDLEKSIIETTTVDNSASSTGYSSNSYACSNTNDKMFLLSYKEATTYYSSSTARKAKGTDYAKCQGLYVNSNSYSYWWLRSPHHDYAYSARLVNNDGGIYDYGVGRTTDYGVRPACYINL